MMATINYTIPFNLKDFWTSLFWDRARAHVSPDTKMTQKSNPYRYWMRMRRQEFIIVINLILLMLLRWWWWWFDFCFCFLWFLFHFVVLHTYLAWIKCSSNVHTVGIHSMIDVGWHTWIARRIRAEQQVFARGCWRKWNFYADCVISLGILVTVFYWRCRNSSSIVPNSTCVRV